MKKVLLHFKDLYTYRPLIWTLVARDIKSRYRGSFLGFLWTFLNPLIQMGIYTLVFSFYLRFEMKGYSAFLFTGLIPWILFSSSVERGASSIVHSGDLITKAIIPPQVMPATMVLSNLVNFLLSLPLVFLFLFLFKVHIGVNILWLPVLILIEVLLSYAGAMVFSALTVYFRDMLHILPNLLLFLFFGTPIIYPLSQVPESVRHIVMLNPLAPLIVSFQNVMFYNSPPSWKYIVYPLAFSVIVLIIGSIIFESYREEFAELI